MKTLFVLGAAIALLSGCSGSGSGGTTIAHAGMAPEVSAVERGRDATSPASTGSTFADAPDRGDLVNYGGDAAIRRGAYRWHQASLSEEHALNAIVAGTMTVSAPDGTPIQLDHDRHVEHGDGNWTWIGHDSSGRQALITFGDSAAFGSIPNGAQAPLRLTTSHGQVWLVTTDASLLRKLQNNEATKPTSPDYFIPPKLSIAATANQASSGYPTAAATTATSSATTTVVDVLVGYTHGFANSLGGQSAARTRIRNLIDITNQAYLNSKVQAQLRLVATQQVIYPDATDNGTALEGLTGFRAPSTKLQPDPAFDALRAAREAYGADLVSLVRKFNAPENGGCGMAWLIGGRQTGIDPGDAYFGYSVVSDGQDSGANGTYFCREESFAHELGHNMGSQHDAGTASDERGAYAYSFGYKTIPGGNFYTVMAYGDQGQQPYRVFSNPRINFCGGGACGVENQADNARSLNSTTPLIAQFRESNVASTAAAYDFTGDGSSEALWHNVAIRQNTIWPSARRAARQVLARNSSISWKTAGVGDFNGDGHADILWRNHATGRNVIWRSAKAATPQAVSTVPGRSWDVAGIGDFNDDGKADILWHNDTTGQSTVWHSASSRSKRYLARIRNLDWKVTLVADFNGDGRADILLRNAETGGNLIWKSGDSGTAQWVTAVGVGQWEVAGAGDFNADGRADILWHNDGTGQSTIWHSASSNDRRQVRRIRNLAWKVGAIGDYNGDGESDMLLRNRSTGGNIVWYSARSDTYRVLASVADDNWRLVDR